MVELAARSFTATIDSLAFGGSGVCRVDGKVCFVPYSCPGDLVQLQLVSSKRSYMTARITDYLQSSEHRVEPFCHLYGECGGCSWQHVAYPRQLAAKREIVANALWRTCRVDAACIRDTVPSPDERGYRQRVQFKLSSSGGRLSIGFFRGESHSVVDAPHGCPIAHPEINRALGELRAVLIDCADAGQLSQLDLHHGIDGVTAVLHVSSRSSGRMRDLLEEALDRLPSSSSMFLFTDDRRAAHKLWGRDDVRYVMADPSGASAEYVLGYRPGGFAQVNQPQNQQLLQLVYRMAALSGSETVVDLYCGNGNFSLPLSAHVSRICGAEGNQGSIASALGNCTANHVTNAVYSCSNAVDFVRRLAGSAAACDVVILDPPRAGAADVVNALARLNVGRIIYISCDPSTLARDCSSLAESGYRVRECIPLDMFPQTYHIESITLLTR